MRLSFVPAVLIAALVMSGCGGSDPKKKPLTFDTKFSVNCLPVPEYWPREKMDWPANPEAARAQKEAWEKNGTPEFFRFVHTIDDKVVRSSELQPDHVLPGRKAKPTIQWIYYKDKKVLSFDGPKVTESPLDDDIATVCMYGDPSVIKDQKMEDGTIRTSYTYYNHGKQFFFVKRKLVDTISFQAARGSEQLRE